MPGPGNLGRVSTAVATAGCQRGAEVPFDVVFVVSPTMPSEPPTAVTGPPKDEAPPASVADMGRVPIGVLQSHRAINAFRPDVVLATGGYVAVPVGVAATRLCRIPLVVHEQTVRLSLANKTLAGAATRVAVSSESTVPLVPEAVRASTVVTGNPVRPEVSRGIGLRLRAASWKVLPSCCFDDVGTRGERDLVTSIRIRHVPVAEVEGEPGGVHRRPSGRAVRSGPPGPSPG